MKPTRPNLPIRELAANRLLAEASLMTKDTPGYEQVRPVVDEIAARLCTADGGDDAQWLAHCGRLQEAGNNMSLYVRSTVAWLDGEICGGGPAGWMCCGLLPAHFLNLPEAPDLMGRGRAEHARLLQIHRCMAGRRNALSQEAKRLAEALEPLLAGHTVTFGVRRSDFFMTELIKWCERDEDHRPSDSFIISFGRFYWPTCDHDTRQKDPHMRKMAGLWNGKVRPLGELKRQQQALIQFGETNSVHVEVAKAMLFNLTVKASPAFVHEMLTMNRPDIADEEIKAAMHASNWFCGETETTPTDWLKSRGHVL